MTVSPDRLRLLHGTDSPLAEMRTLRAGPVTMLLDGIDLRYLRIGGTELVRRVYCAVRDVDWDTVPGVVSGLHVDEREASFRVEFDVRHDRGDVVFAWHGTIEGDESGRVEYLFDGQAEKLCPHNRIGICLHHPWREVKGAPYRARTPGGELEGTLPDLIGVQEVIDGNIHPLFPSFDRLAVELPDGGSLVLDFEGDLWEVEDHRNWTDANFKTYSTPLALGRPAPLEAGAPLRQRLTVTPVDVPADVAEAGPVVLSIGASTGTRVPTIGLGQDRDLHPVDSRERDVLSALGPAHVRVEARLDRADWPETLGHGQDAARAIGAHVELSVHLSEGDGEALAALAAALEPGPPVDRVLVINADSRTATSAETTRPELVDLVRQALGQALPGAAFVGGTEIYFTEINRTRPQHGTWDGICYSISPQIHAFTDIDVMENLDAQAETVRSARAIADGKPVVVSPITLRRRVNFHAAGDPPPTPPGELPDSVDVRQSALYGAAWVAGSLKYVSEAGADAVTYFESTGWRGLLERSSGSELPEKFRSAAGHVFPLYHPLADAVEWRGAEVLACESSDVLAAVAFAVRGADGATRLLVSNLAPVEQEVMIGPLEGEMALRRLNESTAHEAESDPGAFRGRSEPASASGELRLMLAPYEVVRVDPDLAGPHGAQPARRRCHPVSACTAAPARSTSPSCHRGPASCAPTGAPEGVVPQGMESAGTWPNASTNVYGTTAAVVSTVSAPSASGASTAIVGSRTRSTPESSSARVASQRTRPLRSAATSSSVMSSARASRRRVPSSRSSGVAASAPRYRAMASARTSRPHASAASSQPWSSTGARVAPSVSSTSPTARTHEAIAASERASSVSATPMRIPATPPSLPRSRRRSTDVGSSRSKPAIATSTRRTSSTERARGPTVSSDALTGWTPRFDTAP